VKLHTKVLVFTKMRRPEFARYSEHWSSRSYSLVSTSTCVAEHMYLLRPSLL